MIRKYHYATLLYYLLRLESNTNPKDIRHCQTMIRRCEFDILNDFEGFRCYQYYSYKQGKIK